MNEYRLGAGSPVVYFDAYANDFFEDAFLAIAGEILALAKSLQAPAGELANFKHKAVKVGKLLLRTGAKIGVKAATMGILDADDLKGVAKDVVDDVAKETADLTDKYLESILTSAEDRKATLANFKQTLSELPALLAPKTEGETEGNSKPLVFIIDELDRCLPPFALQVIERVKHILSVENVHFVLGVNLKQLATSVRASYGFDAKDAHTYLEKFIHLTVPLVDTAAHENDSVTKAYLDHLSKMIDEEHHQSLQTTRRFLLVYAQHTGLSLRALQRIYTTLALSYATAGKNQLFEPCIVVGLAILKLKFPDLYKKAKTGKLRYTEIQQPFAFDMLPTNGDNGHYVKYFIEAWQAGTDPSAPNELKMKYRQGLARYHTELDQLVPVIANRVVDQFKPPT